MLPRTLTTPSQHHHPRHNSGLSIWLSRLWATQEKRQCLTCRWNSRPNCVLLLYNPSVRSCQIDFTGERSYEKNYIYKSKREHLILLNRLGMFICTSFIQHIRYMYAFAHACAYGIHVYACVGGVTVYIRAYVTWCMCACVFIGVLPCMDLWSWCQDVFFSHFFILFLRRDHSITL